MQIKCDICSKDFLRCKGHINRRKHHFCSRQCYKIWRYSTKVKEEINRKIGISHIGKKQYSQYRRKTFYCESCGKEYWRRLGELKRFGSRFCSQSCVGIWLCKNVRKKNTDIENIVSNLLKESNIEFQAQKQIKRIAIVDFLIKGKVVIEADGDYWHSTDKQKEKDIKRDKVLSKMGYIIIRFLGSEIKTNPQKCLKTIKEKCRTSF